MAMPGVPEFKNPITGKPLGTSSDFWKANPFEDTATPKIENWWNKNQFQDKTQGFANTYSPIAQEYLKMGQTNNPLAGGWDAGMKLFGGDFYPDINNPNTISTTRKWMDEMRGGEQKILSDAARRMAQAQVPANQFMPAGGTNPYAQARKDMYGQLASEEGSNFTKAIEFQRQKALAEQTAANSLAEIYKAQIGAGTSLSGQVLSANQASQAGLLDWQKSAGGAIGAAALAGQAGLADWQKSAGAAYGNDINAYNQAVMSEPEMRRQDEAFRNARNEKAWATSSASMEDAMLKQLLQRPNLPYSTPVNSQWMDYLRNKGLYNYRDMTKASGAPIQNMEGDTQKKIASWTNWGT